VSICERCGMNAVDARGLCHNCGWQAPSTQAYSSYLADDDDSPSLGKTRIAEAPAAPVGAAPGTRVMTPPPTQPTQVARTTGRPGDAPAYCGTCGARLEDGQAFCGQCGSPVTGVGADDPLGSRMGAGLTVAAPQIGGAPASGPARYRIGDAQGWADDDTRTEMFTEAPQRAPYGPYGSGGGTRGRVPTPPYASRGYTSGYAVPGQVEASSSRTLKIVFGLLCLLGGLLTAIAAIVLALNTFH